ncbi:hypothetical protein ACFLQN_03475 [Candidatus Aenigmatarchaeota archaeon]
MVSSLVPQRLKKNLFNSSTSREQRGIGKYIQGAYKSTTDFIKNAWSYRMAPAYALGILAFLAAADAAAQQYDRFTSLPIIKATSDSNRKSLGISGDFMFGQKEIDGNTIPFAIHVPTGAEYNFPGGVVSDIDGENGNFVYALATDRNDDSLVHIDFNTPGRDLIRSPNEGKTRFVQPVISSDLIATSPISMPDGDYVGNFVLDLEGNIVRPVGRRSKRLAYDVDGGKLAQLEGSVYGDLVIEAMRTGRESLRLPHRTKNRNGFRWNEEIGHVSFDEGNLGYTNGLNESVLVVDGERIPLNEVQDNHELSEVDVGSRYAVWIDRTLNIDGTPKNTEIVVYDIQSRRRMSIPLGQHDASHLETSAERVVWLSGGNAHLATRYADDRSVQRTVDFAPELVSGVHRSTTHQPADPVVIKPAPSLENPLPPLPRTGKILRKHSIGISDSVFVEFEYPRIVDDGDFTLNVTFWATDNVDLSNVGMYVAYPQESMQFGNDDLSQSRISCFDRRANRWATPGNDDDIAGNLLVELFNVSTGNGLITNVFQHLGACYGRSITPRFDENTYDVVFSSFYRDQTTNYPLKRFTIPLGVTKSPRKSVEVVYGFRGVRLIGRDAGGFSGYNNITLNVPVLEDQTVLGQLIGNE